MQIYGGIEAGGTKFNCYIATGPENILAEARIPTTTPDETITEVIRFFQTNVPSSTGLAGIGIACFGPLDLDPSSKKYGFITSTPKPGWMDTDITGMIQRAMRVPVFIDTGVNAAAVGEGTWGAAQGLDNFIYLTVGTGIGGGGVLNGKPIHGLIHSEMGHIRIPHDWKRDPYRGYCSYHGDCLEGLACGPAMNERWGQPAETLPIDHPAWDLEAEYLALALANFTCIASPKKIILGGGVMHQNQLFPMIRGKVKTLMNGYLKSSMIEEDNDEYIVPPGLGDRAGGMGALALVKMGLS